MAIRITITLILFLISSTIMTAQKDVKEEFHYANLSKYLNEAIELLEEGDFPKATKKLNYAQKAIDKLTAKGYEADLVSELEQIKACENKIANPDSASKIPTSTSNNNSVDIKNTVGTLVRQIKKIKGIFDFDPAYAANNLSEEYIRFAKTFDRSIFLATCQEVKNHPDLGEPKYRRQVKELNAAEAFVSDLTAQATKANVFSKIDKMMERMEQYKINAEGFQANTAAYIDILMDLMPENNQLKQQQQKLESKSHKIQQELAAKEKASADAQRERVNARTAAASKAADALPVAGLRDSRLEAEFKRLGQQAIGSSFKIENIIITASKWGVTKDAVGRPISRSMITSAIGKDSNGQCFKQAMLFTQNAGGNDYGSTFYDASWSYSKNKIKCQ